MWDILDVLQVIQTAVLEGAFRACVRNESHWAAWALSALAAIFLGEALLLCQYSRGRHPYAPNRFGRRSLPSWVRPLLAFALLTVVGAAPRQPPLPFRDKTPRTDSFWCADGTMQEQLAAAEAAYILSRPLECGGLLPPRVYQQGPPDLRELDPEPLEPELPEEAWQPAEADTRAVHISIWVCAPMTEAESVDVALPFPLTVDDVYDVARDARNATAQTWLTHVVPTTPQLHDDYASVLLIPEWIADAGRHAVLLDARRAGGGLYAVYVNGPLTRYSLLKLADKGREEPYEIFIGGDLAPLGILEARQPQHGLLIKVVPRGEVIDWSDSLADRLARPERWNPDTGHPQPRAGRHIAFQSQRDQYLHQITRASRKARLMLHNGPLTLGRTTSGCEHLPIDRTS